MRCKNCGSEQMIANTATEAAMLDQEMRNYEHRHALLRQAYKLVGEALGISERATQVHQSARDYEERMRDWEGLIDSIGRP